jgi:M6 family metalloprotease-like protein
MHSNLGRAFGALCLLAGSVFADIVWNGKRVGAWPPEALRASSNTGEVAGRTLATAKSGHYPSPKGTVYGLTLLVDFSDSPAPFTTSEISDWLNKEGFSRDDCKGSVRDYYLDVSNGQVDFTNEVFGWYRAKQTKAYYEAKSEYTGSDELLEEVLAHFDPLVDFSRYDNDDDGTTEAISVVYAGAGLTWGQGLWPHSGWVGQTRDATKLDRYQMSDMPGEFSLYVFVHECGHMIFGWPDLYWYGDYCTMANRADDWNPVAINDFFRADQGWIPFQDVTALDTALVTAPADSAVYRYRNPERPELEGFVWSYLRNTGRRGVIKGSGLFLQHYDFSIDGNSSAAKLELRPVQADGLEELQASQWPTKSNDTKDLFQSGTVASFDETRFPLLHWYDGNWSGLAVSEIGKPSTSLAFRLGPALPAAAASSRLEAEKAQVVSALVKATASASGGSYVTGLDGAAGKVVFAVDRPVAGRCSLLVRYANGDAKNASHSLSVNGSTDSVVYRPTGAWARFDSVSVAVDLRAGRNQIVFGKKANTAELDAISLGVVYANAAVSDRSVPAGEVRLRRTPRGFVQAPAWTAGARIEFLDPAGRSLGTTDLVLSGEAAAARAPSGAGLLPWRIVRDGSVLGRGLLLP